MADEPVPAVRRHVAVFVAGVAGIAVLSILVHGAAGMLADSRRSRMIDAWAGSLGTFDEILERYPDREANEAALRVEELGAGLGIDLAPRTPQVLEDRARPTKDAEGRYKKSKVALNHYGDSQLEIDVLEVEPPPAAVREFFDEHRETLDELRRQLTREPAPRWARRLDAGFRAPLPNLLGLMNLQRLLVADAMSRVAGGDLRGARETLEASWRLNTALRDDPNLASQLIALNVSRMQVAMLRHIDPVSPSWPDRLREQDFRASILSALEVDGWNWMEMVDPYARKRPEDEPSSPMQVVLGPYVSLCTTDLGNQWRRRLVELSEQDSFCDRDLEASGVTLSLDPPAWNIIAKQAWFGEMDDVIRRVARYELDREMTLKLLELRRARDDGGGHWPERLPGIERSTTCPDDHWIYETTPAGEVTLAFSRAVKWEGLRGSKLPLRYVANR